MTIMERPTPTTPPPPTIQQRTPRDVSASVRWSLRLGGALGLVGWAVFAFGMIFFWAFVMNADVGSLWQFDGADIRHAEGLTTRSDRTKFTVGGSKTRKGSPVYANEFTFTTPDGARHRGVSYATDASLFVGGAVIVEYPIGRPDLARIQGMRRRPLPAAAALVALVPAVALGLIVTAFRRGGRHANLIENGRLAWGRMIAKEATSARVNKQTVYKMTFEFAADNRRTYQVVAKTHATAELEDEDHELILYDPANPAAAVVADSLPAGVRVDEQGHVHQRTPFFAWLVLPTMALIGHGTYAITTYVR